MSELRQSQAEKQARQQGFHDGYAKRAARSKDSVYQQAWRRGLEARHRLSQADTELSIAAQQQESTNSYVAELEARLSQAEELAAGYKAERDAARKMASLGHTAAQLREATGHLEKVTAFVVQNRIQGALWDAAYAAREWLAASSAGETPDGRTDD